MRRVGIKNQLLSQSVSYTAGSFFLTVRESSRVRKVVQIYR